MFSRLLKISLYPLYIWWKIVLYAVLRVKALLNPASSSGTTTHGYGFVHRMPKPGTILEKLRSQDVCSSSSSSLDDDLDNASNGLPSCFRLPQSWKFASDPIIDDLDDDLDNGYPLSNGLPSCFKLPDSCKKLKFRTKTCFNCLMGYSADCLAVCCCPLSIPLFLFVTLPWLVIRRIAAKIKRKQKVDESPYQRLGIDPTEMKKPKGSLVNEEEVPFAGFGDEEHWNENFD